MAQELGISERIVAQQGEYAPAKSIFSYAFVGRDITGVSLADQIYSIQQKLIKDIADKGPCVIVGRCADFILSDRDDVLNVFIQGNKIEKAERIKELYGKNDAEVRKLLKDVDKKRSVNYRYCTDKEWGNRKNYDVVLNSSVLGYGKCVEIIADIYTAGHAAGSGL